ARLDTSSSSATFCRSTFVGKAPTNVSSKGTLNIVDSILEGNVALSSSTDSNTVIVGKSTSIVGSFAAVVAGFGGRVDIHEGTFGDGAESLGSLVVNPGGTANVYGGEWKSKLATLGECGGQPAPQTLNLYVKDLDTKNELCDGSPFSTSKVVAFSCGTSPNYLECPQDYQVPTFPECE
ncbi:hypothetical protein ACHAWC_010566, partial [Mediolabrus comicus]